MKRRSVNSSESEFCAPRQADEVCMCRGGARQSTARRTWTGVPERRSLKSERSTVRCLYRAESAFRTLWPVVAGRGALRRMILLVHAK